MTKFKPGQSGNPKGRPIGARHKTTLAVEKLLDGEAENLTRQCIEAALGGDMVAMRLVMERIIPARKGRPVEFKLPQMTNTGDLRAAALAILEAVASGDLTPEEGAVISSLIKAAANLDVDNISSDASMSPRYEHLCDEELEKRFAALGLKLPSVD
jgi:hypothetical protein